MYGWIPDRPDHRDRKLPPGAGNLPDRVDLSPQMPPVTHQGTTNSCTAHAVAAAVQYLRKRNDQPDLDPSLFFHYFNARQAVGMEGLDCGAYIREAIKAVAKYGLCPEPVWPNEITLILQRPDDACYEIAQHYQALRYERLEPGQIRSALAAGFPVVFGLSVYESFQSPQVAVSGRVPTPQPGERLVGGHAMLIVGYDDPEQKYLVRNSWGPGWGLEGNAWIPYEYVHTLGDDFWTIVSMEG